MSDVNPYAPPTADESSPVAPRKRKGKKAGRRDIEAALDALEEHIANPENVRLDVKESGGRLRVITIVLLALGGLAVVIGAMMSGDSRKTGMIIGVTGGIVFLLIGAIAAGMDLSLVSRTAAGSPVATMKSYLRGITLQRYGYAWAVLCPTAREQSVNAPDLGPVASGIGSFSMSSKDGMKHYAATFARVSGGQMRALQIKNLNLVSEDGEVATVEASLTFQSWPQWAQIAIGVGAAFGARIGTKDSGPLALVGAIVAVAGFIAMVALRKTFKVIVRKTLLRASNGVWYVYDPDILEGSSGAPR